MPSRTETPQPFMYRRRTLSIEPTVRGFGYAVVETTSSGERLVGWGLAHLRDRSPKGYTKRLLQVVERYLPDELVLEDLSVSRRGQRVRRIVPALATEAERLGIEVRFVSRQAVMKKWGAKSKHELACLVVERFPELQPWLPGKRQAWEGGSLMVSVPFSVAQGLQKT